MKAMPPPSCLVKKEKKIKTPLSTSHAQRLRRSCPKKNLNRKARATSSYIITVWLYQGQKLRNEYEIRNSSTDTSRMPDRTERLLRMERKESPVIIFMNTC